MNKYIVPYKVMRHAKRPIGLPERGYIKVRASKPAYAVCKARQSVDVPCTIEVSKIVEV